MRQIWKATLALFQSLREKIFAEKPFLLFVLKLHPNTEEWG